MRTPVRIEGHTDEQPVATGRALERYETNWELASQRAINVLRYLHESEDVDPKKDVCYVLWQTQADQYFQYARRDGRSTEELILWY